MKTGRICFETGGDLFEMIVVGVKLNMFWGIYFLLGQPTTFPSLLEFSFFKSQFCSLWEPKAKKDEKKQTVKEEEQTVQSCSPFCSVLGYHKNLQLTLLVIGHK